MTSPERPLGVAEAKRRFSELLDRIDAGERIVVARRGRPVVALVPAREDRGQGARGAPTGYAAIAGALADCEALEDLVSDIYAARAQAADRPAPALD
ncbi:MAG: type II toxin-antitoxin system Phd/YefM family antitoxin [Thermoleophilaceae bacterium]